MENPTWFFTHRGQCFLFNRILLLSWYFHWTCNYLFQQGIFSNGKSYKMVAKNYFVCLFTTFSYYFTPIIHSNKSEYPFPWWIKPIWLVEKWGDETCFNTASVMQLQSDVMGSFGQHPICFTTFYTDLSVYADAYHRININVKYTNPANPDRNFCTQNSLCERLKVEVKGQGQTSGSKVKVKGREKEKEHGETIKGPIPWGA